MNPEIRRYAWLDLGWHRLAIAPLLLATLAALPLATSRQPATPLAWGAFGIFVAVTLGWGTVRALASVSEEVRDRTWDAQRMAASTAAELALGKVFGAPLYQWYVGMLCLAVFIAAGVAARMPHLASRVVVLLAGGVLLHALGVALSAAGARLNVGTRARRGGFIVVLLGIVQFVPFLALLADDRQEPLVRWWGVLLPAETFAALSAVLFAGWAVFAAWRALSRELREQARPWGWPAFAAFAALWWAGLATPTHDRATLAQAAAIAAGVLVAGTYVSAVLEPLTPVALARLLQAWRPGAARWQHRVPGWALHGSLAILLGAIGLVTAASRAELPAAMLAFALMAVRDAAVIGCFALLAPLRAPVGRAIFYIALADLLLPTVLMTVGQPAAAQAVFPLLAWSEGAGRAAAVSAVHAVLALAALAFSVQRARPQTPDLPR